MTNASLLSSNEALYDTDLLRSLRGSHLSGHLRVLCVVGAHRFDELPMMNRLFPKLERIYLFEPLEEPLAALRKLAQRDRRIHVFPVAVSDHDGVATFNVASNDGESSSLLSFGSHSELFPEVSFTRSIEVQTRRLESVLEDHGLPPPDVLLVDVQGAEYTIFKSLSKSFLSRVRLIYTEVSTEPVYASEGLLVDVERLLGPRFVNLGFAPLRAGVPVHGNAVFVAHEDVSHALSMTLYGRLRKGFHRLRRRLRSWYRADRAVSR